MCRENKYYLQITIEETQRLSQVRVYETCWHQMVVKAYFMMQGVHSLFFELNCLVYINRAVPKQNKLYRVQCIYQAWFPMGTLGVGCACHLHSWLSSENYRPLSRSHLHGATVSDTTQSSSQHYPLLLFFSIWYFFDLMVAFHVTVQFPYAISIYVESFFMQLLYLGPSFYLVSQLTNSVLCFI